MTDATAGQLTGKFVWFHNFTDAWHNDNFRRALRNTIVFTLPSRAFVLVGAGILAHALVRPFRGRWFLRLLILLPWAAPVAVSTIGFLWIFDSQFSVVNWTLVHDLMPGGGHFYLYRPVNWVLVGIVHLPRVHVGKIDHLNPPQWLGESMPAFLRLFIGQYLLILPFDVI